MAALAEDETAPDVVEGAVEDEETLDEQVEAAADGQPDDEEPDDGAPVDDEPLEEVEGEAVEDDECEDEDDEPVDIFTAIKQELTESRENYAALQDRYARLQAEWDNFRKRTADERAAERLRASEDLVKDLLPVLDDLERAVAHAKESGEGGSLTEGVDAILGKALQILGKHHVEQVEADGAPFDAMLHQAVGTQEDDSVPEETVVAVYQQGYKMGDRVLRPAMVVTSTGGPARQADDEEQ